MQTHITTEVTMEMLENFILEVREMVPSSSSLVSTDVREYTKKLYDKAMTFAIVEQGEISSAAIGYVESLIGDMAYITLVGTMMKHQGKGYASKTISAFIAYCSKKKNIKGIHLHCVKENMAAYSCYKKLGFIDYRPENESRPNDCHLVLWLNETV